MKIRFVPKTDDKSDPIVRLRCDMIIEALGRYGFDIGYYQEKEWADILVTANTDFKSWLPLLEENQKRGQIVIFDLPENEFRRMARVDSKKIMRVLKYIYNPCEVLRRFAAHLRRKDFDALLERLVTLSDHVIVASEDTFSNATVYNKNCSIIYEPLEKGFPRMPKQHKNKAGSIIWIGMPVNIMHVFQIKRVLKEIMDETGVKLKIMTSPNLFELHPKLRDGIPLKIEFIPWDLENLWREMLNADIGIAPLFNYKWKSPNKVTTYWSAGLPVVASPSKTYSNIIQVGQNGFLASNCEEWRTSLLTLIHDPELRSSLGNSGYEKAVNGFSIDKIAGQWRNLFEKLI